MTPIKVFFNVERGERRLLVRLVLRKVDIWRPALRRSWYKRRYWLQGQGTRQAYRAQVGPYTLEWRVLDPKQVKHGKLQD